MSVHTFRNAKHASNRLSRHTGAKSFSQTRRSSRKPASSLENWAVCSAGEQAHCRGRTARKEAQEEEAEQQLRANEEEARQRRALREEQERRATLAYWSRVAGVWVATSGQLNATMQITQSGSGARGQIHWYQHDGYEHADLRRNMERQYDNHPQHKDERNLETA